MSTQNETYSYPVHDIWMRNHNCSGFGSPWITLESIRKELIPLIQCGPQPIIHPDGAKRYVFIDEEDAELRIKAFRRDHRPIYIPFNVHGYLISIRYV